jgi:hypothetical protein
MNLSLDLDNIDITPLKVKVKESPLENDIKRRKLRIFQGQVLMLD